MFRYVIKRIIFALFALFILLTIIFFLMSLLPIIPLQRNPRETEEQYQQALEAAGLTKPLIQRYFDYWGNLFHGNLGLIYGKSTTIQQEVFPRLPNTMYIALIAYVLSIIIGFTFGFIAAIYRGKWQDTAVNILSVIFISVPSFVIGIMLLKLAGVIGLPLKFLNFGDANWDFSNFIKSSIMPILSLTFGLASTLTYYVRNEVVDILNQDYIKTARSKGVGTFGILFKHVFRNALIPALSILGPSLLVSISGSIVLEQMYGVSGIATVLVNSIQTNQVNIVMFQALFLSSLYFLISIILDVIYTLIDPRIKLSVENNTSWLTNLISYEKRIRWHQKLNKVSNDSYQVILDNSDFHNYLMTNNIINYKNKTVLVEDFCYEKFSIKKDINYLVLNKNIFKVRKEVTKVNE
ncbi:ABC transporter permease [Mycoplasmoides pirum]|uniref:ABC transporter permease n=1 Tax=Mycoplasmoides pirum TaxID=2122 RepID=UPI0004812A12|nr:ABC transporter permease [Mycoplasmoides pirum]